MRNPPSTGEVLSSTPGLSLAMTARRVVALEPALSLSKEPVFQIWETQRSSAISPVRTPPLETNVPTPPGGLVHCLFAFELAYHFARGREHLNKLHKPNNLRIHSQETRTSLKPAKVGHFPSK